MNREKPLHIDSEGAIPEKLSVVLNCLPDPTILVGRNLTVEAANHRFRSLYAGDREIVGRPCYEVSHGASRPCTLAGEECPIRSSARSGQTRRALHVHLTPRGLEHVEVTVRPVPDSAGKAISFVKSLRSSTIASATPSGDRLVGRTPIFNRMLEQVERVAHVDSSVLLVGEPGSDRAAVARAIHDLSPRSRRPFLSVDCSGARETRFEIELFGSSSDSDTAESPRRKGLLEVARGGTVYLNEIGELPASAQARLLRALETGTYRRVSGCCPIESDFRLVCSTSVDPQRMIDERRILAELVLRVSGLSIRVPALRDRLEDLELLIETELLRPASCAGCQLGDGTLAALSAYGYPGNLRELRALLEHASILAVDGVILPEHLPERVGPTPPGVASPTSRA